jgi:hypothetical protein
MSEKGQPSATPRRRKSPQALNGATRYYRCGIDPDENFNRIEITLSHLFRKPSRLLGGQTYGSALHAYMMRHDLLRDNIAEIGGGLGDVMRCLLEADAGRTISRCKMIDISPQLCERQRIALSGIRGVDISIAEGNCERISALLPGFSGLVLCNGVIADLVTHRLDSPCSVDRLMVSDPDIAAFAQKYSAVYPYYLPTGTLRFFRGLKACLKPSAVAIVTEYEKTPLNQPSWFENHYEYGIDFNLVVSFAQQVGFRTELLDVASIIGFDVRTPLLTIDMFTMKDDLVAQVPAIADLTRLPTSFPVAAYSKQTFAETVRPYIGGERLHRLMQDLDPYFQPINAAGFDRKNPATWWYKALLLRLDGRS